MKNIIIIFTISFFIAGCVGRWRVEYYKETPTDNYYGWTGLEKKSLVRVHKQGATYILGEEKSKFFRYNDIVFSASTISQDNLFAGPLLPVIPIPGQDRDYGNDLLSIKIIPFFKDMNISFDPREFTVLIDSNLNKLSPIKIIEHKHETFPDNSWERSSREISEIITIEKEIDESGHRTPITKHIELVYDIKIKNVDQFILRPGKVKGADAIYILPDINFQRSTKTKWDGAP